MLAIDIAVERGDFEDAAALRNRIIILRAIETDGATEMIDTTGLFRQRPGAMGLGTNQRRSRRRSYL